MLWFELQDIRVCVQGCIRAKQGGVGVNVSKR